MDSFQLIRLCIPELLVSNLFNAFLTLLECYYTINCMILFFPYGKLTHCAIFVANHCIHAYHVIIIWSLLSHVSSIPFKTWASNKQIFPGPTYCSVPVKSYIVAYCSPSLITWYCFIDWIPHYCICLKKSWMRRIVLTDMTLQVDS